MLKDAFRDRERALENEFFFEVDKKLIAELKKKLDAETLREKLAEATGFDNQLLDELVELGFSVEGITAISLIPMVLVAWADKKVDSLERSAVMRIASEQGIASDSAAGRLLDHWLDTRPDEKLQIAWKHYAEVLTHKMTTHARKLLRTDIVRRAREVARVSGGPMWLGVITAEEKIVIAELENAFDLEK